ncbi:MAG: hypothetical protein ACRC62_16405 [Microcoleus sp.]
MTVDCTLYEGNPCDRASTTIAILLGHGTAVSLQTDRLLTIKTLHSGDLSPH